MKRTLFDDLSEQEILIDPFEHTIIERSLDPALCQDLIASRPDRARFASVAPGRKSYIKSDVALTDDRISSVWKETISAHLVPAAIRKWLKHFAPAIRKRYPDLERDLGPIDHWLVGRRGADSFDQYQALVDAMISCHLECPDQTGQDRGPHIKITRSLLLAELLLRLTDDDCPGGDVVLYERAPGARLLFGPEQQVLNRDRLRAAKTIPYSANKCFTFLNSADAIHCMSQRNDCPYPIFYMNVVLQVEQPLFNLPELNPGKRAAFGVRKTQ